MRQRLLEACVECLVERGWSGTSTTLVSQRAGVSRGAQLHHFPTKNDLVRRGGRAPHRDAGRRAGGRGRGAADRARAAPARCWRCSTTTSPGRCSPPPSSCGSPPAPTRQLHEAVAPLEQRIGREVHRHTVELLGVDESRPGVRELVQATLDLVRGLGPGQHHHRRPARRGRILDQWARTLDAALKETS